MGIHNFPALKENITRNISEVKSMIGEQNFLDPQERNTYDRALYLFQSITRSMIDIGNNIIIERGYRTPLNTADVFISLAENKVIPPGIIPGMKRAAFAMPKIKNIQGGEMVEIIGGCLDDFSRCLSSYERFFKQEESGDQ